MDKRSAGYRKIKPAIEYIDKHMHRNKMTFAQVREIANYFGCDSVTLYDFLQENPNQPKMNHNVKKE